MNTFQDLEFTSDRFTLNKVVGAGGFGKVFEGHFNEERVAVKILHIRKEENMIMSKSLKAELNISGLQHPNVVRIISSFCEPELNRYVIVMEFVSYMNLQQIIDDLDNNSLSYSDRLRYSLHISSALAFVHDNNIIHLDVKPANILVCGDGLCKLCDFGCSLNLNKSDDSEFSNYAHLGGTMKYKAPELLRGWKPTPMCDMYSLALTMWQMKHREIPFSALDVHFVVFGVVSRGLRPSDIDLSDIYTNSYDCCIARGWDRNPNERFTAQDLAAILRILLDDDE